MSHETSGKSVALVVSVYRGSFSTIFLAASRFPINMPIGEVDNRLRAFLRWGLETYRGGYPSIYPASVCVDSVNKDVAKK